MKIIVGIETISMIDNIGVNVQKIYDALGIEYDNTADTIVDTLAIVAVEKKYEHFKVNAITESNTNVFIGIHNVKTVGFEIYISDEIVNDVLKATLDMYKELIPYASVASVFVSGIKQIAKNNTSSFDNIITKIKTEINE